MAIFNGTDGNDVLQGTPVNDVIKGHAGDDRIDGSSGRDILYGQAGNDSIYAGGSGGSQLYGGGGRDLLVSLGSHDNLYGGKGDDRLIGNGGPDKFFWRTGDGNDRIDGGEGPPGTSYNFDECRFTLVPSVGGTSLHVTGDKVMTVSIDDADERASLTIMGVENVSVIGGDGNDTIDFRGYTGHDLESDYFEAVFINGGQGSDRIFGTNDFDYVYAGQGNDFVSLRGGNDTYIFEGGHDRVYLGAGRDTVVIENDYIDDHFEGTHRGQLKIMDFNASKDRLHFETQSEGRARDGYLDTNHDGYLGVGDRGVSVREGTLTYDLTRFTTDDVAGTRAIVLEGITRLDMYAVDIGYIGI